MVQRYSFGRQKGLGPHTQAGFKDFNLRQCLFGLHLLSPETQTVAIVEAEKTAIVASMFFHDDLFLATGGITNLRPETKLRLEDFIK